MIHRAIRSMARVASRESGRGMARSVALTASASKRLRSCRLSGASSTRRIALRIRRIASRSLSAAAALEPRRRVLVRALSSIVASSQVSKLRPPTYLRTFQVERGNT
jgi:hypothetical protein